MSGPDCPLIASRELWTVRPGDQFYLTVYGIDRHGYPAERRTHAWLLTREITAGPAMRCRVRLEMGLEPLWRDQEDAALADLVEAAAGAGEVPTIPLGALGAYGPAVDVLHGVLFADSIFPFAVQSPLSRGDCFTLALDLEFT